MASPSAFGNFAKSTQKGMAITGWLSKNFAIQEVVYFCG
jgi:hypothetical protein